MLAFKTCRCPHARQRCACGRFLSLGTGVQKTTIADNRRRIIPNSATSAPNGDPSSVIPTQHAPAEAEPSTKASGQMGFMSTARGNDAYRVVNTKNKFHAFVGALKQVDNKGNTTLYFHHTAYTKEI